LARHVIGYFIAGVIPAVVTTLRPAGEIPHLPGGAGGPMMFLRAVIVGAPLSVGPGQEVPLTYAMLASSLAAGPAPTFLVGRSACSCPRECSRLTNSGSPMQ
jgi:uncharacterized membrane protein YraQ (UPF0718 family)